MNQADLEYFNLCNRILAEGNRKGDRTGVGTLSVFGHQMRFDLTKGFPLLTTKRVYFPNILTELLWFIKGDTNIRYLLEHNNPIWTDWPFAKYTQSPEYIGPDMTNYGLRLSDPAFAAIVQGEKKKFEKRILTDADFAARWGELGEVYGAQWRKRRHFNNDTQQVEYIDQLQTSLDMLMKDPNSRRNIVDAWNPGDVDKMALPPCHKSFQFYVADGKLSCLLEQRSGDVFLGVPFNIASYALLTHMIARHVGLQVGEFVHNINDAHIYVNHLDQIQTQLEREPYALPTIELNESVQSIFDFSVNDITLHNYTHHPAIRGPVAV